ncbi:MAG TPA: ATP-binding protein [Puia sp.]|nr:ATP-binding protein [Puia sp.]
MSLPINLDKWADSRQQHRPFYMAVVDSDERITFVNAQFIQTFRCAKVAVGKAQVSQLIHHADQERVRTAMSGCRERQTAATVAARVMNSPYQWIQWQISFFPGSEESRLLFLGEDVFGEALQAMPHDEESAPTGVSLVSAEAIIRAQQDERARLAHELHDNINQMLASAQLFLGHLEPGSGEFRHVKARASEILTLAIEEIRSLSREMVMPDFKDIGLTESIRRLVRDLQYCKPFGIRFLHDNRKLIESLDDHRKITLLRIVQEQIKNIVKYARAKHVVIDLQGAEQHVRLEIADDGRGFDPTTTRHGLGLSNIYERTKLYGGQVAMETAPGMGCVLIVTLPREYS